MYDLIIPFGSAEQAIVYTSAVASAAPLTYTSGTYSLTANDGTVLIGATAIEGQVTTSALMVQVFQTIDAQAIQLPAGPSVLEFLLSVQDAAGLPRREQMRYVLLVDGEQLYNCYPTAADVQVLLWNEGVISNPPTAAQIGRDLTGAVRSAVRSFEQTTGYSPFLSPTVDQTLTFDPPGPNNRQNQPAGGGAFWCFGATGGGMRLLLGNGISHLTSVTVGVTPTDPGTVFTEGTDFDLYPQNAARMAEPWQEIRFRRRVWGSPQSVVVVCRDGYSNPLPADAWQAIRNRAAADVVPGLGVVRSGGMTGWKAEDASESYGVAPYSALTDLYKQQFRTAAKVTYSRREIGT